MPGLAQRAFAEWLGTAFLLAAVVGSGIMAQKLSGGSIALALLCNTIATGAIARSLSDTFAGIAPHGVPAFIAAQTIGAILAIPLARWLWGKCIVKESAPPLAS